MAEAKKKNIYETISAVMAEIGAIGKNSKNDQQHFMYRGIDAVMNAINPALIKYHLFVVPEVIEQTREERQSSRGGNLIYSVCKIKYTFYAEDGSSVSAVVVGEGMDSGDKATNKAMSVAFKYACFQVFCIPTEEMVDPDAECHEVKPKSAPKAQAKTETEEKPAMSEADKKKLKDKQVEFVNFCNANGIDYHDYGLRSNSTYADFDKALADAKARVDAKNSGGVLPFPIDTESEG